MDHSEKTNRTKTTGPEETRFVFVFMPNILFFFCGSIISVLLLVGFLGFTKKQHLFQSSQEYLI